MKKYTQNKKIDKDTELLLQIMEKYQSARNYIKRGFSDTWEDCRKVFNSQRVKANYIGSSDTTVPETFTIVQSVKSNVVGGKIKIEFMPTTDDQQGDTKVLNSLMDQIWTEDKTKLKASWAIDDSLQIGNGYLWQYWDGRKPCNLYVPTEDNFFDPTATNYENLKWGGYRYHTTKKALEAETKANPDYDETDPKSKPRIPRYKNLDKVDEYAGIQGYKNYNDKTAKQLREEMVAGSVLTDKHDNVIEVIVFYDKARQIKIANRCVVIEDVETPFKRDMQIIESVDDMGNPIPFELPEIKPFIPVAPARDYVDGAMWFARGEVEIVKDLQELLNDTQNQKSDNLNFTLNRMWVLDPSQSHKKDEIQSVPGAVFTLPPGSLEPLATPSIGVDADNEMYRIQKMMRSATAADEIVQGMKQQGTQTATQINSQLMQAGNRFASKLENYESEFFAILANNMFKILQIFLTQEQAVRIIGQSGVEWKSYNPGEYLGDWDVKVSLEANARAIKEEQKQMTMQFYLMAAKQPFINQEELFKYTASKLFDIDQTILDNMVLPPMPTIGPDGMPMMPQQGAGAMASAPQSGAENAVSASVQQGMGLNVPGMVQG
jgi:hypothetical protein